MFTEYIYQYLTLIIMIKIIIFLKVRDKMSQLKNEKLKLQIFSK